MELLDVVDENNQLTGKTEDRECVHKQGLWHREVAVWIMNEKGEILLQKRAATKKQQPNKWGLTAGHVDASEEPICAAKREVLEEAGGKLNDEELELLFITKQSQRFQDRNIINNHFTYHYLAKTNKKLEEYTIQKEELSELKYVPVSELERVVEEQDTNYTFYNSLYMERIVPILKNKEEKL